MSYEGSDDIKFVIKGRLDALNKVINENRKNRFAGHNIKKRNENIVRWSIRQAKLKNVESYPVNLKITWYEPNKRRDSDNVHSAVKFILDALVAENILENDNQKHVRDIEHLTRVDRKNPRIEVEIFEGATNETTQN